MNGRAQGRKSPPAAGLGAQWGFAFWRAATWTAGKTGPRLWWTAGEPDPPGAVQNSTVPICRGDHMT